MVESFYQYAEQRFFGTVGGVAVVSTDEPVADLVESTEVVLVLLILLTDENKSVNFRFAIFTSKVRTIH